MPLISKWWKGDIFFLERVLLWAWYLFFDLFSAHQLTVLEKKGWNNRLWHIYQMFRYIIVIKWCRNIPVCTVFFLGIRLEHGSIVIPPLPSLLYLCQPLLSEQKGNSPSLCAKALHLNTRPMHAQPHNHFHLCDWDLKGEDSGGGGGGGDGDGRCVCLQGAGGPCLFLWLCVFPLLNPSVSSVYQHPVLRGSGI